MHMVCNAECRRNRSKMATTQILVSNYISKIVQDTCIISAKGE